MLPRPEPTLNLGIMSNGVPLNVPLRLFDTHCQVLAPTGYGKSRLLARLFQELAVKTSDTTVVIDPAGDLCNLLKRWAHARGLQNRLLVIDPRERRLVCGLNPIRPWPDRRGQQAGVLRDIIRRSLGGNETSANTPLASQWIYNMIYALLECGLTMYELTRMLDFSDSTFRDAVVRQMPASIVKHDFESLAEALRRSSESQVLRLIGEQLGSTSRRLRQFVTNEYLMHMLAARTNAIDWGSVIDRGMLVLVNLGLEGNALTDEDQRLLGQLTVSSIIRECFARPEHRRRPVNLLIDEAGKMASPEVTTVLNEGRKYRLRLVLAHQTLSQLVNHRENDTTLLDAVVNNARLKVVFGGLGPRDATEIGSTLYGHLGDPDKRKLELMTPMQLSHVVEVESRTVGVVRGRARSRAFATSVADGESDTTASSTSSGTSSGISAGMSHMAGLSSPADLGDLVGGMFTESEGIFSDSCEGDFDGTSESEAHSEHHMESETAIAGGSRSRSVQRSVTRGRMVVPGEPFEQTTSVQFESLEEQLHRHVSRMIRQPDRHAVLGFGKFRPTEFEVADVPEPRVSVVQAYLYDLRIMRRSQFFAPPKLIEAEIAERHRALLLPAAIEVVDTDAAIRQRRALRRVEWSSAAEDKDDGEVSGAPARLRRRTPQGGGTAAKPRPVELDTRSA
jgi:hypothetical protein